MKCPKEWHQVELMQNGRGVWERYIGKTENGQKKRWRFGTDETLAKVKCHEIWQRWEHRPEGVESWEALDRWEADQKRKADVERQARETEQKYQGPGGWAEAIKKSTEAPKPPPVAKQGITIADTKTLYLAQLKRRIGLIGSLGIVQWTYDQTEHKLTRVLEFLPSELTHLSEMDYKAIENLIYTLAARPKKKANPNASDEVKTEQVKEQVSQRTALGWIQEVKTFLLWADQEDATGYRLPKHVSLLWKIRPEAEEQKIRTVTKEELTALWHGCVNDNCRTGDKGKRRRLFLMLGLNCGFYAVDIATLLPEHITADGFIWKLRRKTRKTNTKLARTKWVLWAETKELLGEYMPLKVTPNQVRLAWERLTEATGVDATHSHLRDTGAVFMEKVGGRELADTYLAHSRKGVIDSYSHPDWQTLTNALNRFYAEFVKPAIDAPKPEDEAKLVEATQPKVKKKVK